MVTWRTACSVFSLLVSVDLIFKIILKIISCVLNTEWFFLDERNIHLNNNKHISIFFVTALSFDNFDTLKQIFLN